MFSDAHTHLTGSPLRGTLEPKDLKEVLRQARDGGMTLILASSFNLSNSEQTAQLAAAEDVVYAAIGLHPWVAATIDEDAYQGFRALTRQSKVVALSELGLDTSRSPVPKEVQLQALSQQLRLSREAGLPVLIHDRGYHREVMEALRGERLPGGAIHGFSGGEEELKEWLDLGFYVSIGRVALQPEGEQLRAVVQSIPQDKLLLETDGAVGASPDGPAQGPARVIQVAEVVASWRGTTADKLGTATTLNLKRLLGV
ncbi:MAG: TatD family hydrolase [Dehalococcoidia bacterium]